MPTLVDDITSITEGRYRHWMDRQVRTWSYGFSYDPNATSVSQKHAASVSAVREVAAGTAL